MSTEAQPAVPADQRAYLRELAREYLDLARQPVMAERQKLWYAHNELRGPRPMVVVETGPFLSEWIPSLKCQSELGQEIEWHLRSGIANCRFVDDDKVLADEYPIPWKIRRRPFDLDWHTTRAADATGRKLGYATEHPITDLPAQMDTLRHSTFSVDREGTDAHRDAVAEIIGDLLPPRIENHSLRWLVAPSAAIVSLMGMELMLMEMAEHPDLVRRLYDFVRDDYILFMQWMEREGLLTLNNANHYAGAGSYGFTTELPQSPPPADGKVRLTDLWLNMNSQETVGISPAMYAELTFPAFRELARHGGLVYYGCCEPVHDIWADCLATLPNLRKVSVSAWCDEDRIGSYLRGSRVIYSRKPRPNYLGVGRLDEADFAAHIQATLRAARGCHLEIIFRDVYTLVGDETRALRAVRIVRQLIDQHWP